MEKTLALCCIVLNEEKVLPRLVESVKDIIDYWVIVDTGSTDSTRDIIPKLFGDIPGELHERPWVDFGHNRTELCKLAKGKADYLLLLDADMTATLDGFDKNTLTGRGYHLRYSGPLDYAQMLLVSGHIDWRYEGVTHEFITCNEPLVVAYVGGIIINHHLDGGSRDNKLVRDLNLLRHGIIDEPENKRYFFYIAQTLKDMKNHQEALVFYNKRITMGGWPEEVWYSMYQSGKMLDKLDKVPESRTAFLEAYEYRPSRAETLFYMGRMCRKKKLYAQAVLFLEAAKRVKYPTNDLLFIEKPVYDYLIDYELSVAYFWVKKYNESIMLCEKLRDDPIVPKSLMGSIEQNRQFAMNAVEREATKGERILITGAGGMLGFAVYNFFKQKYNNVLATDIDLNEKWIKYMDVRDKKSCDVVFDKYKPTIVIHLASVGLVGESLSDVKAINDTNVLGTEIVAERARKHGSKLIYVSTAEVFSGKKKEYTEDDTPNPVSEYGKSKLKGEKLVLLTDGSYVIRTDWLMGCFLKDKGFVRTMYDHIKEGKAEIVAPIKWKGAPTYTYNLVESMYFLLSYAKPGLYHQQSEGATSYNGVAHKLVELLGVGDRIKVTNVPVNVHSCKLVNKKTTEKGFNYMLKWEDAMASYVDEIGQYEKFNDKAVVIVGDDEHDHLWPAFFKYFDEYWDTSFDAKIYFISENKDVKHKGVLNIKTGKQTFGKRLSLGLQQIPEKNVLLLMEDYFLTKKVDAKFFKEAFELVSAHSMDRLGINFKTNLMTYEALNMKVQKFQVSKIKTDSRYAVSLHGIWNREFLLSVLGEKDTQDDVENNATARVHKHNLAKALYYCPGHEDWYINAWSKGFLTPEGHKMFFKVPESSEKGSGKSSEKNDGLSEGINQLKEWDDKKLEDHMGMENMPEVSVLIPVYNRTELLSECLTSLLRQTFKNFRVCIYDDGSGERVKHLVDNFSILLNIKYKRGEVNRGVGYAKQRLLEMVETPYACWMDSDDQSKPERLEKQLAHIKETNVDIVYCDMQWFPRGGTIKPDVSKHTSWEGMQNNSADPTALFKRECCETPYQYVKHGSDSLWAYSLFLNGFNVDIVKEPLYLYRKHDDRIGVHKRRTDWMNELVDGRRNVDNLAVNKFIIVSMYTAGTDYEKEVQGLRESAYKFGVPIEIYEVPNLGDWAKNTHQKVDVISDALRKYKGPVVWTDADSVFEQFPKLFNELDCDVAAHKIEAWSEILSGTVYFAYNETVLGFLDAWRDMNESGEEPDAPNMQFLLESREDIIFDRLPKEYVKIFDNPHQQCSDPVIVHNQASRRLKSTVELHSDIVKLRKKIVGHDSCAIIGNGPFESDLSKEIDASFVMRCNNYKIGDDYKEIGTRVDLNISSLYHEIIPKEYTDIPILGILPISDSMYQRYTDAKQMHVFWRENADKLKQMGISVYTYDESDKEVAEVFQRISEAIKAFPTVGIMAMALARMWGFKKIIVSGFTFFESDKSHYFKDEKVIPGSHHNVKAEKMLLKSWVEYDKDREWVLDDLTRGALDGSDGDGA